MKDGRMAAIVLAAGYSSRMNSFKPFLEFGGHTAVETVVNTFKVTGIEEVVVVAGHRGSEVADKLKGSGVVCTWNKNYSQGMYSSVLKGIEALDDSVGAFFIIPVDIPLVKKHTLELMKRKYIESGKGILYPVYCGKRGHPPLIDIKYRQAILDSSGEGGLERILLSFSEDSMNVPVFDAAVIMDMDKKEDYDALLSYYLMGAPNRDECSAILKAYYAPESIIKHCSEVARVSRDILKSLKGYGCALDAAVLEAAALLHDIAKGQKDHAVKGAVILEEIGYERVGYIISTHMDLDVDEDGSITENEVLYLADKLVNGDRIMPLKERRTRYLEAYCGNLEALDRINKRFDAAEKVVKKIERITGRGFVYG
ncbi:MAG: NTP transferase domain-containing protein [Clostridiales bacterium]|nr:NTP transferase domain-containing protein [Clostridiales bacterium]